MCIVRQEFSFNTELQLWHSQNFNLVWISDSTVHFKEGTILFGFFSVFLHFEHNDKELFFKNDLNSSFMKKYVTYY